MYVSGSPNARESEGLHPMRRVQAEGAVAEALSRCMPGQRVAAYFHDQMYHERVLFWKLHDMVWGIVTGSRLRQLQDKGDGLLLMAARWWPLLSLQGGGSGCKVEGEHGWNHRRMGQAVFDQGPGAGVPTKCCLARLFSWASRVSKTGSPAEIDPQGVLSPRLDRRNGAFMVGDR